MEVLLILAFVGGVIGIPIFAIVVAVMIAKGRREKFHKVMLAHGLQPVTASGYAYGGIRNGVRIYVAHASEGSGKNRVAVTYVRAFLDPPLRLGIQLHAQGIVGQVLEELVGAGDVKVGDPAFDAAFSIRGVEPAAIARLFNYPELRVPLLTARRTFRAVTMSDDVVHISMRRHVVDEATLVHAMDWIVSLGNNALLARNLMGPTPAEQAVLHVWTDFARTEGLQFDPQALVLAGKMGNTWIEVIPVVDRGRWATRFRANFGRPLPFTLRLRRQGALSGIATLFGMQDIKIGDPDFDRAFVVQGAPEGAVKENLSNPTLRATLVNLLNAAQSLDIHEDRIMAVAAGLVHTPGSLRSSIAEVTRVAHLLTEMVRSPSVGAYR